MFVSNTIQTEIVTITPKIAHDMLMRNTRNRGVSEANVQKIMRALSRGEWELNGEAIKIAKDGRILDGQHRLTACFRSGIPITSLVVYGLDDNAQETMDAGRSRTVGDMLKIRGYKSAGSLSAILTAIIRMEKWGLRAAFNSGAHTPVTTVEARNRIESEPSLQELTKVHTRLRGLRISSRVAGALYYEFSKLSEEDTEYFFDKLATGHELERGNPILALRNTLQALAANTRGNISPLYQAALVIKAWNKFRMGENCLKLSFRVGGANPEKFPSII